MTVGYWAFVLVENDKGRDSVPLYWDGTGRDRVALFRQEREDLRDNTLSRS